MKRKGYPMNNQEHLSSQGAPEATEKAFSLEEGQLNQVTGAGGMFSRCLGCFEGHSGEAQPQLQHQPTMSPPTSPQHNGSSLSRSSSSSSYSSSSGYSSDSSTEYISNAAHVLRTFPHRNTDGSINVSDLFKWYKGQNSNR
jgi:hypothetical protein